MPEGRTTALGTAGGGQEGVKSGTALALPLLQWRLHSLFMGQPPLDGRYLNFSQRSMSHHPGQFKFSLISSHTDTGAGRQLITAGKGWGEKKLFSAMIIPYVK